MLSRPVHWQGFETKMAYWSFIRILTVVTLSHSCHSVDIPKRSFDNRTHCYFTFSSLCSLKAPKMPGHVLIHQRDYIDINEGSRRAKRHLNNIARIEAILGGLSVLISIGTIILSRPQDGLLLQNTQDGIVTHRYQGIWSGSLLILCGAVAVLSGNKQSSGIYTLSVILSIATAIVLLASVVLSVLSATVYTYLGQPTMVSLHAIVMVLGFSGLITAVVHSRISSRQECNISARFSRRLVENMSPAATEAPNHPTVRTNSTPDIACASASEPIYPEVYRELWGLHWRLNVVDHYCDVIKALQCQFKSILRLLMLF